ncbi:low temperature requirement protein A [Streptomyces violascens]|uniref:Membrane protein n=1 Tax=Streptomyces violascens TaxID=67381 RepID=A0ABQ3QM66_9ACTN|nr:membrane protein [Streptomyces violascens]GHI38378.1 membrane protein [Streptomyces violascens]
MTARSRHEEHRASTPLELFFDLCFVVAVAQAGARLVHALAEGHVGAGLAGYAAVFFAIWWAWMNFTWFASAYDTDDALYRVVTLVQITGVLILAAGVPRAFDDGDFTISVIGYIVMRLALTSQWLRAAASSRDPAERQVCLRYAAGLVLCQLGWVGMLFVPDSARTWVFPLLALAELSVPMLAELRHTTSWHPHHIAERYGLFTLIVLGETVSAATIAVQEALDEHDELGDLLPLAAGGLLIVFAAWWIYFAVPIHDHLTSNRQAFLWGYGHYVVLASAAAIGAGMEVAVEQAVGKAHISAIAAGSAVTVPAALFMLTVWGLHSRHFKRGMAQQLTLPVSALTILGCTFAGRTGVPLAGAVAAVTVAVGWTLNRRRAEGASPTPPLPETRRG